MPISVEAKAIRSLLLEAGSLLSGNFLSKNHRVTKKIDGTPVSESDLLVHELLLNKLPEIVNVPVISEEDAKHLQFLPQSPAWVVDPIDGTKEFLAGIPEFGISIGLWDGEKAAAGGVLNPATGELGCAGTGGDSIFENCADATGKITNSRTEFRKYGANYPETLKAQLLPMGGIAYKLLRVAAGTDKATFSLEPKSAWDVLGGFSLLRATKKPLIYPSYAVLPLPLRLGSGLKVGDIEVLHKKWIDDWLKG